MCKKDEEHIPLEALQHYDELRFFQDLIDKKYILKFKPIVIYRTVRNNPPKEEDFIPNKYQEVSEVEKYEITLSQALVDKLSPGKQQRELSERALSFNDTLEHSIEKARESYKNLLAKEISPEEAELYKQKRGKFVTKLTFTPECGIITCFTNGHADVLPYDGALTKMVEAYDETTPFEYEEINETEE